jgi:hypothetical protein
VVSSAVAAHHSECNRSGGIAVVVKCYPECRGSALVQVKIIILTTFDLDKYIFEVIRVGASGFLVKDTEPVDLDPRDSSGYPGRCAAVPWRDTADDRRVRDLGEKNGVWPDRIIYSVWSSFPFRDTPL